MMSSSWRQYKRICACAQEVVRYLIAGLCQHEHAARKTDRGKRRCETVAASACKARALRIAQRLASHFLSETSAFALDFYQRKCDDFSIGSSSASPSTPSHGGSQPFPDRTQGRRTEWRRPAARADTRKPLHAQPYRAVPPTEERCAVHKVGEAASESLATAIDGGYQVEQLESWRWDGNPGR